ncbi:MAG: hypothetical protein GY940_47655, partial [bacterium]|nr:hypothetical protein [bacterium]
GGPYTLFDITIDKYASQMVVTGLEEDTTYYFVVRTRTDPHSLNSNTVDSEYSREVSARTLSLNAPPVALCKGTIEIPADGNCLATITASDVDNGSYDPDPGDQITLSLDNPGPFSVGTHNVVLTVTDQSGESDSCMTQVIVTDQSPPAISLSDPVCVQVGNGNKMANKLSFTAWDNCSGTGVDLKILKVEVYNNAGNLVQGNGVLDVIGNDIYVYPNGTGWSVKVTFEALDEKGNKVTETVSKNLNKC